MKTDHQNKVLLSVAVTTYNHKKYISQCLDGILMQQTTFPFEIILGEDESIDGTREICIDYANKHPDIIKLFLRSRNDVIYINGNPTGRYNFIENLKAARGTYIALCEGDDYWTDPLKLQKQVDFLEANQDINLCFHLANLLEDNNLTLHHIPKSIDGPFEYKELLKSYNFITTASVVFRKPEHMIIPKWFYNIPFGDLGLYKIVSQNSKIYCIPEILSVYRIQKKGIYSGISIISRHYNYLKFYNTLVLNLSGLERKIVKGKIKERILTISKIRYPNNFFLRILFRFYLKIKY